MGSKLAGIRWMNIVAAAISAAVGVDFAASGDWRASVLAVVLGVAVLGLTELTRRVAERLGRLIPEGSSADQFLDRLRELIVEAARAADAAGNAQTLAHAKIAAEGAGGPLILRSPFAGVVSIGPSLTCEERLRVVSGDGKHLSIDLFGAQTVLVQDGQAVAPGAALATFAPGANGGVAT